MVIKEFKEQHQKETLWRYSTVVGCVKESLLNPVGSIWQPSSPELLTESALLKCLASVSLRAEIFCFIYGPPWTILILFGGLFFAAFHVDQ